VVDDELSVPLGQNAKPKRRRPTLPINLSQAIAAALGLFVLTFAGWPLTVDDPLGGEPVAVVATGFDPPKAPAMPSVVSAGAAQRPRSYDEPGSPQQQTAASAQPSGTKTVTIIDGSTGKRQEVAISAPREAHTPLEQRLLESSKHGGIPRIATDGARAQRTSMPAR
jgi:uncharacterized protein